MDDDRFDAIVLSLGKAIPRRAALAGVLSAGLVGVLTRETTEAKKRKKKCKGGKKKCGKKCFDLQTNSENCGSCGNRCDDDKVCRDGNCSCPEGETECGDICCPSGQICGDPAINLCVVGQGTCPSGADSCEIGSNIFCNSPEICGCFKSTSGATRCGKGTAETECGQCTTDEDCEVLLSVPGAFCVANINGSCPCPGGGSNCAIPCPG